jgi:hypothetical protein
VLVSVLRLGIAVAVVVATTATLLDTASRSRINPFNFFGFFTVQSNLMVAAVYLVTAVLMLTHRAVPGWLITARAAVTTYIVVVGLVYNTLLTNTAGGVELVWANTILHVITPIYCLLDWVVFGDRDRLSWNRWGYVAIYPVVWLLVVLIRGATDGWVPYPFLNPANGYLSVAGYAVAIAVVVMAGAAGIFALSRFRPVDVPSVRPRYGGPRPARRACRRRG